MEDTTTTTEDMAGTEVPTCLVATDWVPTEEAMVVTMDTTAHHSKEESGVAITDTMIIETDNENNLGNR